MAKSLKDILMMPVDTDMSAEGFKRAFGMGKSYPKAKKEADMRKREASEMSKRITEKSYEGKNVTPDKKPAKASKPAKKTYTPEPLPTGNIGAASGEMGPDMGRVNRMDRDIDYSGMSRMATPEEAANVDLRSSGRAEYVDPQEQARRSMGFKKGGVVKGSSASRRGDGCAVRGKTRGKIY